MKYNNNKIKYNIKIIAIKQKINLIINNNFINKIKIITYKLNKIK